MNNIYNRDVDMTPEEKFQAVGNLKQKFQENFVMMGQLLSEIKVSKLFKKKGYGSFKEFVENEYNISNGFAGKLIRNYNLYINELNIDEEKVKEIGLDKLNMIRGFVKDAGYQECEDWIDKAENLNTGDLREKVKDEKERRREKKKTMKEVFIDQYKEKMVQVFNCSQKEIQFKLALYFQDLNLDEIKVQINRKEKEFQDQIDDQI